MGQVKLKGSGQSGLVVTLKESNRNNDNGRMTYRKTEGDSFRRGEARYTHCQVLCFCNHNSVQT